MCLPPSPPPSPVRLPASPTRPAVPAMLPGTVAAQYIRCGKPNCRCTRGHRHGPYYYRSWREGGKVKKAYVAAAELEAVQAACAAWQAADQEQEAREQECPTNARLEAMLHAGRDTARRLARALAAAARTQESIAASREIGKDVAAVTAQSRHLADRASKTRQQAQATRSKKSA